MESMTLPRFKCRDVVRVWDRAASAWRRGEVLRHLGLDRYEVLTHGRQVFVDGEQVDHYRRGRTEPPVRS